MKAGRELDALIAEKVLGWKRSPPDHKLQLGLWREKYGEWSAGLNVPAAKPNQPVSLLYWVDSNMIPPYSTDIAAAWVVGESFGLFVLWGLCKFPSSIVSRWEWVVHSIGPDTSIKLCYGETAPLAICLSALKFMEKK